MDDLVHHGLSSSRPVTDRPRGARRSALGARRSMGGPMPNEVIAVAVTIEGSLGLPELAHLIGIQSGEAALERARLDAYVRMAIPSLRRIPAEGATLSEMCEAISLREIGRARGTILAAVCLRHLRFGVRKDGAPDRVCVLELFPEFPCLTEFGRTAPEDASCSSTGSPVRNVRRTRSGHRRKGARVSKLGICAEGPQCPPSRNIARMARPQRHKSSPQPK